MREREYHRRVKPDRYEQQYMAGGGGEILQRDRTIWRWGVPILGVPGLAALGASIAIFAGADPSAPLAVGLIPLLPAVILGACAALFTVLRVVVSTKEVHVQYGLFGPRIPIADIRLAEVIDYDWTEYGGWGVRMSGDGTWAYSVMGSAGKRAIRIRWTKGGKEKTTVVTSADPESILAAIQTARARAGTLTADEAAAVAKVRVAEEAAIAAMGADEGRSAAAEAEAELALGREPASEPGRTKQA